MLGVLVCVRFGVERFRNGWVDDGSEEEELSGNNTTRTRRGPELCSLAFMIEARPPRHALGT